MVEKSGRISGEKYIVLTQEIVKNIKNSVGNIKKSQRWTTKRNIDFYAPIAIFT